MRLFQMPIQAGGKMYSLDGIFGFTLVRDKEIKIYNYNFPEKLKSAIIHCNQPYKLKPNECTPNKIDRTGTISKGIVFFMLYLAKLNFFLLLRKLNVFIRPRFSSSSEAIIFFRQNVCNGNQKSLCLTRSLFAAYMSKKFKNSGVIFIGIFLPSRSLHAWIIEDGIQPDPYDWEWINFKPLAAIL